MTVISNTNKGGPWAGDGATTRFDFAFYAPSPGDVRVYVDNVLLNDGYTVVLSGSDGGYVLFDTPPASGTAIAALRLVEPTQETDIQNNTAFYPEVIENALDKLTMICQQLQEAQGRSLAVGVTDIGFSAETLIESVQNSAQEAVRNSAASADSATAAANEAVSAATSAKLAEQYKNDTHTLALKATGIPIGTIYPSMGELPPDGSFWLNGQTIEHCRDDYPEFWQWVAGGENAGVPIYREFVMPKMTENGVLGGDTFAAKLEGGSGQQGDAFWCFKEATGAKLARAFITPENRDVSVIFYTPNPLKLTHVEMGRTSQGEIRYAALFGSNDNASWNLLSDYSIPAGNWILNGFECEPPYKAYRYFKFTFRVELPSAGEGWYTLPDELELHGEELDHIIPNGSAAPLLSNEEYEAQLLQYGICGGVVVDNESGSVRLPTWGYQAQLPGTLTTRGNGTALGITDGDNLMGLEQASGALHAYTSLYDVALGAAPATKTGGANALGVTLDPDASGLVTDVAKCPSQMFRWVIQVFNAPIPLSTQDSYALAAAMQLRAQTDLANVASNIDFIVKHEDLEDGSWYDLYRSGKVVQGGTTPPVTTGTVATEVAVSLPIEMADTNYQVWLTLDGDDTLAASVWTPPYLTAVKTSVRAFTTKAINTNGLRRKSWLVIGKAAANVKE